MECTSVLSACPCAHEGLNAGVAFHDFHYSVRELRFGDEVLFRE